ncbi:hypothetical protein K504DRAFT_117454 [Pleomassaria siparia CBS 279.74]|uniref:Uncharacterized protein n=1 Tax=Pleomassaria siparia CBS 279.74 TaxID=1314801 RepID=A0A6G1JW97_9PLEO|nr:hypothetical protein K504DRAFT_117454 [Pleomassaria siparia CBS 279.74]
MTERKVPLQGRLVLAQFMLCVCCPGLFQVTKISRPFAPPQPRNALLHLFKQDEGKTAASKQPIARAHMIDAQSMPTKPGIEAKSDPNAVN